MVPQHTRKHAGRMVQQHGGRRTVEWRTGGQDGEMTRTCQKVGNQSSGMVSHKPNWLAYSVTFPITRTQGVF